MKRFKKLTIYILVGVLLSSSVMLSYRKADEVKAAAGTLTLSAAALVAIGLLGAYGIVYKGAVDSTTGNYIWQSQPDSYPQELENALPYLAQLYNTLVYQSAQNGGYDPNDDWDGDEDKPPIWDKLVKFMNENQLKALALGGTVLSSIVAAIGYAVYQESQGNSTEKKGVILGANDVLEFGFNYSSTKSDMAHKYNFNILSGDNVKAVCTEYNGSDFKTIAVVFASESPFQISYSYKYKQILNGVYEWKDLIVGSPYTVTNYGPMGAVNGKTIYFYRYMTSIDLDSTIFNNNLPLIPISYNLNDVSQVRPFLAEMFGNDFVWEDYPNLLTQDNIGISSDIKFDDDNESLEPIFPLIQIPSAESVGDFLGGLSTNVGNESGTQAVVDQFVNSLQQTQPNPNPEGGVVPDPSPDPNPEPNPNPNPDIGGEEGEEDSEKDKSNLLADLKDVFPFCIPFDLIDCFRLFNAEPETPRVEIPLHFGIVDKDYTFVIDLKDFDGVAQVCRTMFLILFMTGLVLSTRSLIRG